MNEIYKLRNLEEISLKAINILKEELKGNKEIAIAFSGGKTPRRFYELLKNEEINWAKVHIFFVDERQVPIDSDESVVNMLNDNFLKYVDIPKENIHFPSWNMNHIERANEYENIINTYLEKSGKKGLDLIFLGMGADGHTASLFHMNQTELTGKVTAIDKDDKVNVNRITLTREFLVEGNKIIYLISGDDKKEMFDKAIIKRGNFPANSVRHNKTIYLVDFL